MPSLLDSINGLITADTVSQLAGKLGESDVSVSRGVQVGLAAVLAGLANRAEHPTRLRQLVDLAANREQIAGPGTDLGAIVRGVGVTTNGAAGTFLTTLFGSRSGDVAHIIARNAGLTKATSSTSVLAFVSTLVLGYLGRELRDGRFSLSSLGWLLSGERDTLRAAAPSGLLEVIDAVPSAPRPAPIETHVRPALPAPVESRRDRWVMPLVGGLAAVALLWALVTRNREPRDITTVSTGIIDSTLAAGHRIVDTAAGTVAGAARDLGAFGRVTLPGGRVLDVPANGIESRLVTYIEDPTRTGHDTTWFDFDRLNFATRSATILPQSQEQLDNIAAVLTAYPKVHAKVGGYTDNVGSPAANMRLSQSRAESVRNALIDKGIAASRLTAEGYGEQHPVADNATEEGRARNRRIAIRVTGK